MWPRMGATVELLRIECLSGTLPEELSTVGPPGRYWACPLPLGRFRISTYLLDGKLVVGVVDVVAGGHTELELRPD